MKRKGKVAGKTQKAYKLRLFPTQEQVEFFAKSFGCVRFVYNRCLEIINNGVKFSYEDFANQLPFWKEELEWLKEPPAQTLQQSIVNLWDGFQRFWKGQNQRPSFKRKFTKQSFRIPQANQLKFNFKGNLLFIPKCGWVRCIFPPRIYGLPKSATISKTNSGRYQAAILCEIDEPQPIYKGGQIGIDLGLRSYIHTSQGFSIEAPRFFRQIEDRIASLQRKLDGKVGSKKGEAKSKNWLQLNLKIAKIYQNLVDRRTDWLHKLTTRLVRENQAIMLESLSLEAMKQTNLAKSIQDACLGEFVRQLKYKGPWFGCFIGQISQWFPSSKLCSVCKEKNTTLQRGDYEWVCLNCQTYHNRDQNAAVNILNEGYRLHCAALVALHIKKPLAGAGSSSLG